jgi:hypothetical protein
MPNTKHSDNIVLSNAGKKWTEEEHNTLLEELNTNIDINLIAQSHNRTTGAINARCKIIAYDMYKNNIPMEEIYTKTKLNEIEIMIAIEQIENKQKRGRKKKDKELNVADKIDENKNDDITVIKNDIIEIKKNIKELVAMMKALYEFEHS